MVRIPCELLLAMAEIGTQLQDPSSRANDALRGDSCLERESFGCKISEPRDCRYSVIVPCEGAQAQENINGFWHIRVILEDKKV